MSRRSNKSYVSKIERELQKTKTADPCIWLRTASGDLVTLEFEFGWQSSMICDLLDSGFGLTRSKPICLSPGIAKEALEVIFHYFRFSQAPGRTGEECQLFIDELLKKDERTLWMLLRAANCLQHNELTDMIRGTLAQNTEYSFPEVEQGLSETFEQCVKGEELEPQKNPNGDLRTRLSNKLLAKQKKNLGEVENVKKAEKEVEAQKGEDRSVDDLISFINGDGDTKGVKTSKKKKKNHKKGKEKKKTTSSNAFSSTESSASKKVTENHEQDKNASDSANRSTSVGDKLCTQDESFNVEGDTIDDDLDSALMEDFDREVEAFSLRLKFLEIETQKMVVRVTEEILIMTRVFRRTKVLLSGRC